jgi:GT2 family glycosyltransferase
VAVVIPTFERAAMASELLAHLADQTLAPGAFEVIVVDDCSQDGSMEIFEQLAPLPYRLRVLRTAVNRGPAAARNLGWQATEAPIVAFIDDDCTPSPRWLAAGLAAFSRPTIGVVQGRTHVPEGESVEGITDWYVWREVEASTPYFEGCNLLFRHDVLQQTGGFDEEIRYYGEDCAAGWRVMEAGYERAFAVDASVSHAVERRGFRWFVRNGLLESRLVHCAAKHPGFRATAWCCSSPTCGGNDHRCGI